MTKRIIALVYLVTLMVVAETQMDATRLPVIRTSSAFVEMLGEFRIVAANMLWIKTDEYHHEYEARHADPAKNRELIGMCQLITRLNPRFEQAYLVGAMVYRNGEKNPLKALHYLQQGLHQLPSSWQIPRDMAFIEANNLHNRPSATVYAELAYKNADDPFYKRSMKQLVDILKRPPLRKDK